MAATAAFVPWAVDRKPAEVGPWEFDILGNPKLGWQWFGSEIDRWEHQRQHFNI
jgi:hypothetical protein